MDAMQFALSLLSDAKSYYLTRLPLYTSRIVSQNKTKRKIKHAFAISFGPLQSKIFFYKYYKTIKMVKGIFNMSLIPKWTT